MIIDGIKDSMILVDEGGGGDYTPCPEGSFMARCIRLVDLGTQASEFEGEKKSKREVMITWEVYVLNEDETLALRDNGSPFEISKRYTASLNEKASLRKHLDAWRGRPFTEEELTGFDLPKILNTYCLINIQTRESKKGKKYAFIAGIMAAPRGTPKPEPINAYMQVSLRNFEPDFFAELPEYVQDIIKQSAEWPLIEAVLAAPSSEAIPF